MKIPGGVPRWGQGDIHLDVFVERGGFFLTISSWRFGFIQPFEGVTFWYKAFWKNHFVDWSVFYKLDVSFGGVIYMILSKLNHINALLKNTFFKKPLCLLNTYAMTINKRTLAKVRVCSTNDVFSHDKL